MGIVTVFLGVIISCISIILIQWATKRYNKQRLLNRYGIPGPKPNFLDGNLREMRKEPTSNGILTSWNKKYGDVFGYYVGDDPYVVVKDLDILKQVLIKDFSLFTNRPELYISEGIVPISIIGSSGRRWKDVRNVITPMFTSGKLKYLSETVGKKVDVTVDLIANKAENGEMFEIYSMVQGLTLEVIAATVLAIKTNCQKNNNDELLINVRHWLKFQHNKLLEFGLMLPFLNKVFELFVDYTIFGKATNYIIDNINAIIKQRSNNPSLRGSDILQSLLDKSEVNKTDNSGTILTSEEVLANAFSLFIAGYETTATSLALTFYLLIKHPEIQEKLYEEIRNAKDSTYSTVLGLPYLDQVYNESLRIYPPVTGFVSRNCSQDYKAGPYTFPKGCEIIAPVWDIHHDPDLWPDPWKFDPDRFSSENKKYIKSMSFLPFGDGPRNCVGSRFALMESKMCIFKLLKRVKLEACQKTEDNLSLVCHTVVSVPANGVWLKATLRND